MPLVQAAQNVVPVAVTTGDKIESLRQLVSGRCLPADRAGVYSRSEGGGGSVRRVVRAMAYVDGSGTAVRTCGIPCMSTVRNLGTVTFSLRADERLYCRVS